MEAKRILSVFEFSKVEHKILGLFIELSSKLGMKYRSQFLGNTKK
jgi:hypothetical protein